MDKPTKKKLKIVAIIFAILIIPIGYLMLMAYAIDLHNEAYYNANIRHINNPSISKQSITQMDKAFKIYPFRYMFRINKAELQLQIKDYKGALASVREATKMNNDYAEGWEFLGLIYHNLNNADSTRICYNIAIEKLQDRLEKEPKNEMTKLQIANLYWSIGDSLSASKYAKNLPFSLDHFYRQEIEEIK